MGLWMVGGVAAGVPAGQNNRWSCCFWQILATSRGYVASFVIRTDECASAHMSLPQAMNLPDLHSHAYVNCGKIALTHTFSGITGAFSAFAVHIAVLVAGCECLCDDGHTVRGS
jgi:hypothetical protein